MLGAAMMAEIALNGTYHFTKKWKHIMLTGDIMLCLLGVAAGTSLLEDSAFTQLVAGVWAAYAVCLVAACCDASGDPTDGWDPL